MTDWPGTLFGSRLRTAATILWLLGFALNLTSWVSDSLTLLSLPAIVLLTASLGCTLTTRRIEARQRNERVAALRAAESAERASQRADSDNDGVYTRDGALATLQLSDEVRRELCTPADTEGAR